MKAPKRKITIRKSHRRTVIRRCAARLQEPSTYASLAAVAAVMGLQIDPSVWRDAAMVGAALAGMVGIILPEGSSK